jgi:hypothetical protein
MPEGTDRKKISQWLILGRGQPAGKEVQYPWLHPWYQAGLVSGVLKKSYFTPKPPKGGFLNYWISISPPSPSRSRFGGERPGIPIAIGIGVNFPGRAFETPSFISNATCTQ